MSININIPEETKRMKPTFVALALITLLIASQPAFAAQDKKKKEAVKQESETNMKVEFPEKPKADSVVVFLSKPPNNTSTNSQEEIKEVIECMKFVTHNIEHFNTRVIETLVGMPEDLKTKCEDKVFVT